MSELRRWSEEGGTADEIALVEASRRERVPSNARARTLKALGIAVAVTSVTTSSTVAATTAAATKGGLTALTKVLAIALLGGGILAGGLAIRGSLQAVAPSGRPVVVSAGRARPAVIEASNRVLQAPSASDATDPRVHPGAPARAPHVVATEDRLSREVTALELAHKALTAHNPDATLRLLTRYRAQFPSGILASEEIVLRAQALLANGDRAGAQALAAGYSAAHPDSPYARRLEELVHAEP
jgi:hypothetical protein